MKPPEMPTQAKARKTYQHHLDEAIRLLDTSGDDGAAELAGVIKTCRAGMRLRGEAGVVDAVFMLVRQMDQAVPGTLKKLMEAEL